MTYEEMIKKALEYFKNNTEVFNQVLEELDSWNGYLGDDRCYDMSEIDDMFCGISVSEFLDRLASEFNHNDNYFFFGVYGVGSTNEKDYSDYLYESTVEDIYDNRNHLWLDNYEELNEIFNSYEEA